MRAEWRPFPATGQHLVAVAQGAPAYALSSCLSQPCCVRANLAGKYCWVVA